MLSILPLLASNAWRTIETASTNPAGKEPSIRMSPTLGETIRQARVAQGLAPHQLARLLEVNPTQVSRWENDSAVPSPTALAALAEQLELRASALFELAGVPLPSDRVSLPAMLRADYNLPPEAIADVEAYIAGVAAQYHVPKKRSSSRSERRET